jgi:hypothetical protein
MTPRQWLELLGQQPACVGGYLALLPVLAFLLALVHRRGAGNDFPWKYLYSTLVYAACIPGSFGAVVVLYVLLFAKENLLDVNALVTFAPIAAMAVTLAIVGRNASLTALPGFGRLSGLLVVLGLTFAVLFALSRTHLWVVFGGSAGLLVAGAAFVFALIKWGGYMAFRRHDEPEKEAPKFGE